MPAQRLHDGGSGGAAASGALNGAELLARHLTHSSKLCRLHKTVLCKPLRLHARVQFHFGFLQLVYGCLQTLILVGAGQHSGKNTSK